MYAWWTISGTFGGLYWETRKTTETLQVVPDHGAVIPCQSRELKTDPIKLPALPNLPDLPATGLSGEERRKETRLIKIATSSGCLIGLTNKGHVLKLNEMEDEDFTRIWHYVSENACPGALFSSCGAQLPYFSEIGKIKESPAFHPTGGAGRRKKPPQVKLSSDTLLITHVSTLQPTEGPRSKVLSTFRFLHMVCSFLPTHPPWCSRGKSGIAHRCTQLSPQSSRTDLSSPSLPAAITLVLSPPPELS